MPAITLDRWKEASFAILALKQTSLLKEVTRAFEIYVQRPTSVSLDRLASAFQVWRTTGPVSERTILTTAADDLQTTITTARQTNQVINVKASNVGQSRFYDLVSPLRADMLALFGTLAPNLHLPPLTPSEIAKINEAFSRARRAAELARDAMVKISARTALAAAANHHEALYLEYCSILSILAPSARTAPGRCSPASGT